LFVSEIRVRQLAAYRNPEFDPGRGRLVCGVWYFVSLIAFESGWLPISRVKVWLLRLFGAQVGQGVVIKPHVTIKFPWKLEIGNDCWIGQHVWIDNLVQVTLESDVCISQGSYLCTGSHDRKSPTFELRTGPIVIAHGAWLTCRCVILQNVRIGRGAVIGAGRVVWKDVPDGEFLRPLSERPPE
jgi:putative colanic acid biosynthesis acetyltransferase WcaF